MAILLLIILAIAIGSRVVYKDNFVILTGTINGSGETNSQAININYPNGLTKDNCVVINASFKNKENTSTGYSIGTAFLPADVSKGSIVNSVSLREDCISITIRNIYISTGENPSITNFDNRTLNYVLVLMKI